MCGGVVGAAAQGIDGAVMRMLLLLFYSVLDGGAFTTVIVAVVVVVVVVGYSFFFKFGNALSNCGWMRGIAIGHA